MGNIRVKFEFIWKMPTPKTDLVARSTATIGSNDDTADDSQRSNEPQSSRASSQEVQESIFDSIRKASAIAGATKVTHPWDRKNGAGRRGEGSSSQKMVVNNITTRANRKEKNQCLGKLDRG